MNISMMGTRKVLVGGVRWINMKKKILIFQLLFGFIGMVILLLVDWKIAIGIFLLMWANNLMLQDLFRKIWERS